MATTRTRKAKTSSNGQSLKSFNPRTGEVMREIPATNPGEVADIVAQARKVQPEWAAIAPQGRANILKEVRYRIYDLMDDIVETVAAEAGKPRAEALAHDIVPPMLMLSHLERTAPKALRSQKVGGIMGPLLFGTSSRIDWRPYGVVGAITPWNYPITNCFLGFAPALFAGNVVVIKPSEVTPACGELMRQILEPLPPGVANVMQGGGDVGAALVDAPCDKISFIGSPATGRKICEAAAKHLTPVVMELGGKDAAIVLEDADIDVASSGILWGAFFNAGQTCCSIERAFVVDSVADDFEDKLVSKLQLLRQGGEDGDVGSLTFKGQFDKIVGQVADAKKKGANILAGGEEGRTNEGGSLWFAPTVVKGASEEMDIVKEENFGPILTITRVQDQEEAIRRANESFNLTASVWTKDRKRADDVATKVKAGGIGSNDHGTLPGMPWAPWGGVGESGFGRLSGELGIREFTVPTHIAHSLMPGRKKPFWYPYDETTTGLFSSMARLFGSRDVGEKIGAVVSVLGNFSKSAKTRL
ncbi:MAG TPA: aldehyde dehydrogenase family protein [Actinomycetota bacterium]|nr:aldehyde dehydrogenase family protein [Actinomycetota bacterium]